MIELPLVGRTSELAQLVDDVTAPQPGAVIVGPAGIGKSRLGREVLAAVGAQARPTRRIVGTPAGASIPFGAVTSREFATDLGANPDAVAAAWAGAHAGTCPVILIDEVHHLDDASAHVVHQLLVNQQAAVILTVRAGEPTSPTVASLLSDRGLAVRELRPLADADAVALIASALDGVVETRTSQQLIDAARGNVLFLRELIEGSIASGALRATAGVWRMTLAPAPTPLLRGLIDSRLRALEDAPREIVELLALGAPIPLEWMAQLADPRVLEELERSGLVLIVARGDGPALSVELAHPLYAELTREALPITTRRRLSGALASVAGAQDALNVGEAMRSMTWRLDSGEPGNPERLLTSARVALAAGDTALGARLATAAFEAGGGSEPALFASWCLAESGDSTASTALLERALTTCVEWRERVTLSLRLAEDRWWSDHDEAAALQILEELVVHEDERARPFVDAQRGIFAVLNGDVAGAHAARPLVDHADAWVASNAALAVSLALVLDDHTDEGAALSARAFERTQAAEPGHAGGDPGVHVATRAFNLACGGSLAEAHALGDLIHEVAVTRPGIQARAWGALTLAQVTLLEGRLSSAHRWATQAEVLWMDSGYPGPARWGASLAALALTGLGDVVLLAATVERAQEYDARGFAMFDLRLRRAAAWSAHLHGDPAAADLLLAAARDAHSLGIELAAVEALSDLVRLGYLDQAGIVAEFVTPAGPLNTARLRFARAALRSDAAEVQQSAADLAGFGVRLEAAEAFSFASRAFRASGQGPAARECAQRCAVLLLGCDGAKTPLLADAESAPKLSSREREIVSLAAGGLANRAIAETLVVSERTVENHLYRTYAKLGVGTRADLAALAELG